MWQPHNAKFSGLLGRSGLSSIGILLSIITLDGSSSSGLVTAARVRGAPWQLLQIAYDFHRRKSSRNFYIVSGQTLSHESTPPRLARGGLRRGTSRICLSL